MIENDERFDQLFDRHTLPRLLEPYPGSVQRRAEGGTFSFDRYDLGFADVCNRLAPSVGARQSTRESQLLDLSGHADEGRV